MSHASDNPVRCADSNCKAQHPSGKWGTIRANAAGWFHQRDGNTYCPAHVPKWVRTWRTK